MLTGDRRRTSVAAAVTALAVALVSCGGGPTASLSPGSGGWQVGSGPMAVGTKFDVGFNGFPVDGNGEIHIASAQIVGVPDGLQVDGVYAISFAEMARVGCHLTLGAGDDAWVTRECPRLPRHPAHDAILYSGKRVAWYFIGVVHATRPGDFKTRGFQIDYLTPDGERVSHFYAGAIEVTAHA